MDDQDKGHLLFLSCLIASLYQALDRKTSERALAVLAEQVEQAKATLLGAALSDGLLESFEFHAAQWPIRSTTGE
ncbi:MAG: hypothetical protein ACM3WS_03610 [Bacillota bacterium]